MTNATNHNLKLETLRLFKVYAESHSVDVRNRIMEVNLGLVRKEAHHWTSQCTESFEDLSQVGCLGLIRAIERFDVSKGNAFSSFAIPYIRGEIQHFLRDKSNCVRIPRRWLDLGRQAIVVQQEFRLKYDRAATDEETACMLGVPLTDWQATKLALQNRELLSLDIKVNGDDDGQVNLGDCLAHHEFRSFQLSLEDQIRLQQALAGLEERTRRIVEFVFLHDLTQREAAEVMGVSVITVSRRIKQGISALKKALNTEIF
ncbi:MULTISPECIES: RNA polymerase sigma factor SigF [unclassified Synechocystis]|uniref:RNA polymerase sigma factor SigF n=1 Tax=unclassified Synechocystis TaxID=2640012 RepID=UPI000412AA80|nr:MULTISPECIES: RNA polymerase sigma factor SigF [unclassified Synechocystis]AIE73134.1 Cyanobacterial SigF-related sigma factor [Synechocystis sp. PCC 6714]MCT0254345.1 RNA polymerase sigma factor SigF [Synechocystis sp. CS-94]